MTYDRGSNLEMDGYSNYHSVFALHGELNQKIGEVFVRDSVLDTTDLCGSFML